MALFPLCASMSTFHDTGIPNKLEPESIYAGNIPSALAFHTS
jgi:hypothetical protein